MDNQEPLQMKEAPVGKFKVSLKELINIAQKCQERLFAEEIDYVEEKGGNDWLEKSLCTSFSRGITGDPEDLEERNRAFGNNIKPETEMKSFIELFLDALEDFTLRILLVAACISIIIDVSTADADHRNTAWLEGFAIFVAVFVCSFVTAFNDYQKERQFQKLNSVADERKRVSIIRNGKEMEIHQSFVMSGDIVKLFEGMEIPADGYCLEASDLTMDESAMTGETDPIKKNNILKCIETRNRIIHEGGKNTAGRHDVPSVVIMSGTRILSGEGKMMIIVVGDNSCLGKIGAILRGDDPEATPLQEKLEKIARDIGRLGLIGSVCIVFVLLLRFAIVRITQNNWDNSIHLQQLLSFFIIGITVVVVAIPEGLPLAVTLSLAFSVKKMLADQNLVRRLQACETMGGANMICSDKTGTLTQNKMSLIKWWNCEIEDFDMYSPQISLDKYIPNKQFQELFLIAGACNSSAALRPEPKGSKTEIAILEFFDRAQVKYETYRDKFLANRDRELRKFPFSSKRKRMGILLDSGNGKQLHLKGASEIILASCTQFQSKKDNSIVQITPEKRAEMEKAIEDMARQALRTIGVAYKNIPEQEYKTILEKGDSLEKDKNDVYDVEKTGFTLIAIYGIKDILREEVPRAIQQCKTAGIKVRMVTGDNKLTAYAIAKECGIIEADDKNSIVIEGPDFMEKIGGIVCKVCQTVVCDCPRDRESAKKMNKEPRIDTVKNQEVFDQLYPKIAVMARSLPEHKYALVTGLIEKGHVVAVTGDGTNDAPALKKADVGFAMGIAGTEVARNAAAIILLDDNFNSIVKAVMWGRNVYDCIKKFLQFQLTVNIAAVLMTLIGSAIIQQEILSPIQMLWINLIMDTFAALALATEPPTEALLNRKPQSRTEYIISKKMFKHIVGQAIYQIILILILVFAGDTFIPEYEDSFDDYIKKGDFKASQKYNSNYHDKKIICSGRFFTLDGNNYDYYLTEKKQGVASRHFTMIFNTFVWCTIFNFVCARKLQDEFNIFGGIERNGLFPLMMLIIIGLQIILVTFAGRYFGIYLPPGSAVGGLVAQQWLICIGFGSITWIVNILLKLFPEQKFCIEIGDKGADPVHSHSKILSLKRNNNTESFQRRFSQLPGGQYQHQNPNQKVPYQPVPHQE